jgi:hypothetical protein
MAAPAVYAARTRIAGRDQDPLILEDMASQKLNRVSTFKRAGVSRSLFETPLAAGVSRSLFATSAIVVAQESEETGSKRPSSPAGSDKVSSGLSSARVSSSPCARSRGNGVVTAEL